MKLLIVSLMLLRPLAAHPVEELNFTKSIGELRDLPQQLPAWLRNEAEKHLAKRPKLDNLAAVKARGSEFRKQILANIGGLPERTPLNARTVGVIERENFRIEKIIFATKLIISGNMSDGTSEKSTILRPPKLSGWSFVPATSEATSLSSHPNSNVSFGA